MAAPASFTQSVQKIWTGLWGEDYSSITKKYRDTFDLQVQQVKKTIGAKHNIVEGTLFDKITNISSYVKFDGKTMEVYIWNEDEQQGSKKKGTYYKGKLKNKKLEWKVQGKRNVTVPKGVPNLKEQEEQLSKKAEEIHKIARQKFNLPVEKTLTETFEQNQEDSTVKNKGGLCSYLGNLATGLYNIGSLALLSYIGIVVFNVSNILSLFVKYLRMRYPYL